MKRKQLLLLLMTAAFCFSEARGQTTNTESFDGTTFPPTGWVRSSATYLFRATAGTNPTQAPHTGTGEVEFNSYAYHSTTGTSTLTTPVISWIARGTNTPTVSFWFYRDVTNYNTNTYNGEGVTAYVNTTNSTGGGATALGFIPRRGGQTASGIYLTTTANLTTTTSGWYQYSFNVPASFNTATNYIIFQFATKDGNNCFMDDVQWVSYPSPSITVSGTPLSTFYSTSGVPSAQQTYTVSGSNLTNNIVITSPTGFEISLTSGSGFASTLTLIKSGTSVSATTIYVRSNSASTGTFTGTITNTSTGATTVNVTVNGDNRVSCGTTNTYTADYGDYVYWSNASNWSLGHVPLPCEDVLLTFTDNFPIIFDDAVMNIDIPITVHSLTMKGIWGNGLSSVAFYLQETSNQAIHINGNLSMSSTGGNATNQVIFIASTVNCDIDGTATIGQSTDTKYCIFGGEASNIPRVTFNDNVTVNKNGYTSYPGTYIFNKIGAQTFTNNSTQTTTTTPAGTLVNFGNVTVGNSGATILTITGSATANQQRVLDGNLKINAGSTVILPAGYTFNRAVATTGATGTLSVANAGLLQLGGSMGGQTGSNFPSGYTTISLNTGSMVEYNGLNLNQTIYPTGATPAFSYGNITLSNGGTKTVGNACPGINGTVYITGPTTIVDDGGHTFGQAVTNLTQDGGRFKLTSVGTKPDMAGTYALTGGIVEFASPNVTAQNIRIKSYQNIEVTGANVAISNGDITLNQYGTFKVKTGGTYSMNDNTITCPNGAGAVTVENNGLFKTGNDQGFSGFAATLSSNSAIHSNITNILLNTGSTVEYTGGSAGTKAQVFSSRSDYYNVTISGASTKTMNGDVTIAGLLNNVSGNQLAINDFSLTLNGTITGTGTLVGSYKSGLILGYSGTVGILKFTRNTSSATANNYLDTLFLRANAKATIQDTINISANDGIARTPIAPYYGKTRGLVLVESGATLATGASNAAKGLLIFKSNEYGDGSVGQSAGSIIDTVQVERYTFSRRAWRLYGFPFASSNQSINASLQEGEHNLSKPLTCPTGDPAGEYGTWITYAGTNNGYDWNTTNYPSIYYWENGWIVPSSTYINILAHRGYYLFNRGSRQQCIQYATSGGSTSTTLRVKGILNQTGNPVVESFLLSSAEQSVLLNNPYASPINFTNVSYAGINPNAFIILDPDLTGTYGVSGFNTYSTVLPTGWLISDPNSLYTGRGPIVQSGQAYFVRTIQTNASATFTENSKVDDEFNVTGPFPFKAEQQTKSALYAELRITGDGMSITDAAAICFRKDFSRGKDVYDASKKWNQGEGLGIKGDSDWYAIDCRPDPILTDTFFLGTYNLKQQQYTIQLYAINKLLDIPSTAWFVDTKEGSKIPISITGDTTKYTFMADGSNTTDKNRFLIVFRRQFIATPIPVTKVTSPTQTANTNVDARELAKKVTVFPNPAVNYVIVSGIKIGTDIIVTDAAGKIKDERKINSTVEKINCSLWANGTYFLKTKDMDLNVKFVKAK